MSVNISPSEIAGPTPLVPDYVRADGGVRVDFAVTARSTAPARIAESAGYRVRFPKGSQNGEACEAVLINTGGGMAGGDRMVVDMRLAAGAQAVVTTQSAEKVYRAQRAATEITVNLDLAGASRSRLAAAGDDPLLAEPDAPPRGHRARPRCVAHLR